MNKTNNWIFILAISAFFITIIFTLLSNRLLEDVSIFVSIIVVLVFITVGVIFDMIGISIASTEKKSFHSMASKKVKAAKTAIKMVNQSDKLSSFCNDVIGDICNIISGGAGIIIAHNISVNYNYNNTFVILIVTSLIASLTIGGKAFGKYYALKNKEDIVYKFAHFLSVFEK